MSLALPDRVRPHRLHPVAAGAILHRNHPAHYPGAAFNPCRGAPTRFAPLHDPEGRCIPGLYAATSLDGAAYETLFRGPPGRFATVARQDLDGRAASRIAPRTPLLLVPLFTPELRRLGLDPEAVFRPSETTYAFCRRLAETAWRDNPEVHGLIWTSVRDDSAQAMLLFGDRVGEGDLRVLDTRMAATDAGLLDDLVSAGARAGFRIAR